MLILAALLVGICTGAELEACLVSRALRAWAAGDSAYRRVISDVRYSETGAFARLRRYL